MENNYITYTVRFTRIDGTSKLVTGCPNLEGARMLASDLLGGRIIASCVNTASGERVAAFALDGERAVEVAVATRYGWQRPADSDVALSDADVWRLQQAHDALLDGDEYDVAYALRMLRLLDRPNAYSMEAARLASGGYLKHAAAACRIAAGIRGDTF